MSFKYQQNHQKLLKSPEILPEYQKTYKKSQKNTKQIMKSKQMLLRTKNFLEILLENY